MTASTIATIEHIEVRYKGWALGPVSAELPRGCTALLGTNGAGKTTLMRALLGLQRTHSGSFSVGSTPVTNRDREFRALVGYVPQRPEFPRFVTARQALHYAADLKGLSGDRLQDAVDRAAERVDLTKLLERPAAKMSGGQQQRLALAQATVHDPAFVILDEPTAGLDPIQRLDFRRWLRDYCAEASALVSTHLIEDVEPIADHVLVVHDGTAVFNGSPSELSMHGIQGDLDRSDFESALWALLNGASA